MKSMGYPPLAFFKSYFCNKIILTIFFSKSELDVECWTLFVLFSSYLSIDNFIDVF